MRLIDADALLEEMRKISNTLLPADTRTTKEVTVFNSISGLIGNAPTVQSDSADGLGIEPMRADITITHLFYILNKYNEQIENVDKRSIESSIELIRKQHSIIQILHATNAPTVEREISTIDFLTEEEKDGLKFQKNKHAPICNVQREGWVSVPIEPTDEMAIAGYDNLNTRNAAHCVYKAMTQAAPTDTE